MDHHFSPYFSRRDKLKKLHRYIPVTVKATTLHSDNLLCLLDEKESRSSCSSPSTMLSPLTPQVGQSDTPKKELCSTSVSDSNPGISTLQQKESTSRRENLKTSNVENSFPPIHTHQKDMSREKTQQMIFPDREMSPACAEKHINTNTASTPSKIDWKHTTDGMKQKVLNHLLPLGVVTGLSTLKVFDFFSYITLSTEDFITLLADMTEYLIKNDTLVFAMTRAQVRSYEKLSASFFVLTDECKTLDERRLFMAKNRLTTRFIAEIALRLVM